MKKLTTKDLDVLKGIITDGLEAQNNSKIRKKKFNEKVEEFIMSKVDHLYKPYLQLHNDIRKLVKDKDVIERKIQEEFDLGHHYGYIELSSFTELQEKARAVVAKKYKLVKVPDKFDIEKMIYMSSSTDFQELTKSIITQISKQNEYTEV